MTKRNSETGKAGHSPEKYWTTDPEEAFGGLGPYTTMENYFEVLLSLLKNDGRLLSQGARDEMFSPQLTPSSKEGLKRFLGDPVKEALGMGGSFSVGSERDHSLAGMYLVEDPGDKLPRKPGTIAWLGLPNVYWFIDPTAVICGIFGSQLKPSDDPAVLALSRLFEKTMYERMLDRSNGARVIWAASTIVDSSAPKGGMLASDWETPKTDGIYNYTSSKTGNWFLASEFARRERVRTTSTTIHVAANPGNLRTAVWREWSRLFVAILSVIFLHDTRFGAYTFLQAGLSPALDMNDSSSYIVPWGRRHSQPRADILNSLKSAREPGGTGLAEKFYDWCEEQVVVFR